jgi:hypothetical protein
LPRDYLRGALMQELAARDFQAEPQWSPTGVLTKPVAIAVAKPFLAEDGRSRNRIIAQLP